MRKTQAAAAFKRHVLTRELIYMQMHAHAVIYLFNRSQALQRALSVVRLPAAHYVTPSKPPAPVVHAAHAQGGCTCAVGSACACVYLRRRRQGLEVA